jgi:hypothetical protein
VAGPNSGGSARGAQLAPAEVELAEEVAQQRQRQADDLRAELLLRLRYAKHRERHFATKRRDIPPV